MQGERLGFSQWQFVLRRIYDKNSGICALAPTWVFKIRQSAQGSKQYEDLLKQLERIVASLAEQEQALKRAEVETDGVPAALCEDLAALRGCVVALENASREPSAQPADDTADLSDAFFDSWEQESRRGALRGHSPVEGVARNRAASSGEGETSPTRANQSRARKKGEEPGDQNKIRVLIVDDRDTMVERLLAKRELAERIEWVQLNERDIWADGNIRHARHFSELLASLQRCDAESKPVDVLLMDLRFEDLAPEELLGLPEIAILNNDSSIKSLQGLIMARQLRLHPRFSRIPIVLMTSKTRLPAGADLLLDGLDGLQFVDDEASLDLLANRLVSAAQRNLALPDEGDFFWGQSARMQKIRREIRLLSQGTRTIFLTGPSGSGKSFLVEHVILPLSGRSKLVTLDLSSIPDTLVESELFGHAKGAFSGADRDRTGLAEEAEGGILFLDEIGNLSAENQRKLLLFLQDKMVRKVGASHRSARVVDVKVVTATHLDLGEEVEAGRFRLDLFMRLRPATQVQLPGLSERREDIENLIVRIVDRMLSDADMKPFREELSKKFGVLNNVEIIFGTDKIKKSAISVRFPLATLEAFRAYGWPGNTRELESMLDALVLKAFSDARDAHYPNPVLEIDHYYALTLMGSVQRMEEPVPKRAEKAYSAAARPRARVGWNLGAPVEDLKSLRQELERQFYMDLMDRHNKDSGAMCEEIFGQVNEVLRHKLVVRLNQLGIKLRED